MINALHIKFKCLNTITIFLFSISIVGCSSAKIVPLNNTTQQTSISVQVTESTVITFPDKNLEQTIREEIQCPTGDILKDDVDKITKLQNTEGKHIANLSGIEHLTNLSSLDLGNNQISNVGPLKDLTSLTNLNLATNQISNIEPLKNLTNLTNLDLGTNQMSDIEPLKGLTNLTNLNLAANKMSNIESLKNLTKLTNLDLATNQMSNIEPLKGLTNLTNLDLATNQISNIESLKGLTNLIDLDLATNQMNNIDSLKGLTNLTSLDLATNQMSNIDPIKELDNLIELNLETNQIKDYSPAVVYCKSIVNIDIANTDIAPKQKIISGGNQVTDSPVITYPDDNFEKSVSDTIQSPIVDILKGDVDKITIPQSNTNISGIENHTESDLDTNNISNIDRLN
ncbi:leucine-rich repeat domain-containing protein [Clostridium sp.]|uniref:leucine-rich repeat domain-containing protein n=1 Tax=Clostridium sp. TaxID=1506 RepID=UPI003D6D192C